MTKTDEDFNRLCNEALYDLNQLIIEKDPKYSDFIEMYLMLLDIRPIFPETYIKHHINEDAFNYLTRDGVEVLYKHLHVLYYRRYVVITEKNNQGEKEYFNTVLNSKFYARTMSGIAFRGLKISIKSAVSKGKIWGGLKKWKII